MNDDLSPGSAPPTQAPDSPPPTAPGPDLPEAVIDLAALNAALGVNLKSAPPAEQHLDELADDLLQLLRRVQAVERRQEEEALAEATVKVRAGGGRHVESAEGHGHVGALDNALRKALSNEYPELEHITLEDYRVRVLDENIGTGATVRVLVDTSNGQGEWTTVGVSSNIIEASWEALTDGYLYGLLHPRRDEG